MRRVNEREVEYRVKCNFSEISRKNGVLPRCMKIEKEKEQLVRVTFPFLTKSRRSEEYIVRQESRSPLEKSIRRFVIEEKERLDVHHERGPSCNFVENFSTVLALNTSRAQSR